MADVGEEGGLRPVQLGQRLRPPPLGLEGPGVAQRGGDLPGGQLQEGAVLLVEGEVRADPGDQDADPLLTRRTAQRQHDRVADRVLPVPADHPEPGDRAGQLGGVGHGRGQQLGRAPDRDGPAQAVVRVEVDRRERQVQRVAAQGVGQAGEHGLLVAPFGPGVGELVQQALAPFAEHLVGHLGADGVHPGDQPVVAEGGAWETVK
ncbi:hypothetical protein A7K94_0206590 [Modestobacter sp. VKM Ac-2676]|nr:hypothetical protein A7K94_0206590 [Modestobacter sp. VKM Ac-2676]